jgi:hypothetical protein
MRMLGQPRLVPLCAQSRISGALGNERNRARSPFRHRGRDAAQGGRGEAAPPPSANDAELGAFFVADRHEPLGGIAELHAALDPLAKALRPAHRVEKLARGVHRARSKLVARVGDGGRAGDDGQLRDVHRHKPQAEPLTHCAGESDGIRGTLRAVDAAHDRSRHTLTSAPTVAPRYMGRYPSAAAFTDRNAPHTRSIAIYRVRAATDAGGYPFHPSRAAAKVST